MTINWAFSDTNENAYLELSNGTLHSKIGPMIRSTDLEIVSSRDVLEELISTEYSITQALEEKRIDIEGNVEKFLNFWETLTDFPLFWPIIEP